MLLVGIHADGSVFGERSAQTPAQRRQQILQRSLCSGVDHDFRGHPGAQIDPADFFQLIDIDLDAHHGDGVFYAFEGDPDVIIADVHQDPRTLFPGTGFAYETGTGEAEGTKLNIPMRAGSGDAEFASLWPRVESHLEKFEPDFFLFQCGADGLGGDPLAGLNYTSATHALAARRVRALADRHASGRLMAFGGGGYNRQNLGKAWSAVLEAFVE